MDKNILNSKKQKIERQLKTVIEGFFQKITINFKQYNQLGNVSNYFGF